MINYRDIKELTLEDLLKFIKQLDDGMYPEQNICIGFQSISLNQQVKRTTVNNQEAFGIFLSYLYSVYRKIEMKMERAKYPYILQDNEPNENNFAKICVNLDRAKEEYQSMKRNDFLNMYPVIRKLFHSYTDYIKAAFDLKINIDEGDYLPGTVDEMKHWLEQLNTWFPRNINGVWKSAKDTYIVVPPGYSTAVKILRKTTKFQSTLIIDDNRTIEPYIEEENKKLSFGFVNMEGVEPGKVPPSSTILGIKCPKDCTPCPRKWICTKCGEFVRSDLNYMGQPLLFCSCGKKKYNENILICHHPGHQFKKSKLDTCEVKPIVIKQEPIYVNDNSDFVPQSNNGIQNIIKRKKKYPNVFPECESPTKIYLISKS